jgi:hypothetical protein
MLMRLRSHEDIVLSCQLGGEEVLVTENMATGQLSRREFVVTSIAFSVPLGFPAMAGGPWGFFQGQIVAEWLPDGRTMQLTEPFEYIGPDRRSWRVPKGTKVDGASIPSVFWSIIGTPFVGLYRGPSVVHDFYCDVRTRKYQDVHQAFHDAMLCAGVGPKRAWLMYQAVAQFGPHWTDPKINPRCETFDANCRPNAARPQIEWPNAGKDELRRFADRASGQADPQDLAKLREEIEKMLEDFKAGRCVKVAPDKYECP